MKFFLTIIIISIIIKLNYSMPADGDLPGRSALDNFPLIDGHNDLPNNLYEKLNNNLDVFEFHKNMSENGIFGKDVCNVCHTDLPRLKAGKIGAQFWVAYVNCNKPDAISRTLSQIDVINRLVEKYPADLKYASSADDILEAFKEKKIASLIGVEGGHSIDESLAVLRIYYQLGVRYLTLTHVCNLNWADSATIDTTNNGTKRNLSNFGKKIILEMNRLGMMVDLSHVSRNVMLDALETSKAPVIFSHSSAKAIFLHVRNVDDKVLHKLKANNGIIMVNFYSKFIAAENASIATVISHINHIVDVIGVDFVGIGSDFDGVPETPVGLEDVSKYPILFDRLKEQNPTRWSISNLEKLAGRNFIRVFKQVEKIRDSMRSIAPTNQ